MQPVEECKIRCDDIERTLTQANQQWRDLEERLEGVEERFMHKRADDWKKWFKIEESDLDNFNDGGLRSYVRSRIQTLLFGELLNRMQQAVQFVAPVEIPSDQLSPASPSASSKLGEPADASNGGSNHILNAMSDHFEKHVRPVIKEARDADEMLDKKIRKTEKEERKKGVVALGMQDTKKVAALKRQKPEIWESAQRTVEKLVSPIRRLKEFLTQEIPADKAQRFASTVPVVAVRAICDWYFTKSLQGYEDLDSWWAQSKASMQKDTQLWAALEEKEGMILRRIDNGMDKIGAGRRTYNTHANFGGTELEVLNLLNSPSLHSEEDIPPKLQRDVQILVNVVSQMHQSLKGLRDGAIWRVLDAASEIYTELCEKEANSPQAVWKEVSQTDCADELLEALGVTSSYLVEGDGDIADAAVEVMGRLEKLSAAAVDLDEFFGSRAGLDATAAAGLCGIFKSVLSTCKDLDEELLALFDDPSPKPVQDWLLRCSSCLGGDDLSEELEARMAGLQLQPDALIPAAPRNERRHWLLVTKGLVTFLGDVAVQSRMTAPLGPVPPRQVQRTASPEPLAATVAALREAQARVDMGLVTSTVPLSPRVNVSKDGYPYRPPERKESTPKGSPSSSTPGFVKPAWRPDTPSTAAEEADPNPSAKFVDGQLLKPRPITPQKQLPPLTLSSSKKRLS